MKKKQVLLCWLALQGTQVCATIIVRGNDTNSPFGFTTVVRAKVFDRTNGTFYVGLEEGSTTDTEKYAVSCATRPGLFNSAQFTGIAKDAGTVILESEPIEFLALLEQTNASPILAVVTQETTPLEQTFVIGLPTNGDNPAQSDHLNDASGTVTSGIVGIAAKSTHIFAAVRPNGGNFGDADGGIALISVQKTSDSVILETKDATTGLPGNQAQPLDASSVEVKGTSGGQDVTFPGNPGPTIDTDKVALHYDKTFDRLYIGLRIQTGNLATDIGKAVVTARIDASANSMLKLEAIVADSAITAADDEIVVTQGANEDLRVKHIRTLHASTGPSYLIINGGKGTTDQIGNKIRALPLVNDPTDLSKHGLLADVTIFANGVYTTPATAPGDLFEDSDTEVIVGNGDLPMADDDEISDIVVVGDTVYVSIAKAVSATNDTGIFYSQALFASDGRIARWTPWTKRAVPFNAFEGTLLPGSVPHSGSINFFDVDAKTGNIWIVEGTTGRVVGITAWAYNSQNSLITQLNTKLSCGSFSVLDLDQATRGFVGNTTSRYALFGGTNKVVFARTTQATGNSINSPQTVISDFSSAENILVTELPQHAGCVTALEYGRRLTGSDTNYFFAGTET
ncbi:MAG: hypothetical protein Q8Q25_00935, partial [bacterium]|nr:hypothetical protein [bacterium]